MAYLAWKDPDPDLHYVGHEDNHDQERQNESEDGRLLAEPCLGPFRLVSRTFCGAVSPLFFRRLTVFVKDPAEERALLSTKGTALQQMMDVANNRYARCVDELVVEFSNIDFVWREESRHPALVRQLESLLPATICLLSRLKHFEFRGPSWYDWRNETPLPQNVVLLNTLPDIVGQCLSRTSSKQLKELRLEFPSTYHFSRLLASADLAEPVFPRLERLSLAIIDESGPGGVRFGRHRYMDHDDPIFDEADTYQSTDLQALYPNVRHQESLLSLIEQCPTLVSLKLCATHFLDLNSVDDSKLSHLRHLHLTRFTIRAAKLSTILQRNKQSLYSIYLNEVELSDGTWDSVFSCLVGAPKIMRFIVSSVGYTLDHPQGLRQVMTRPWEDFSDIEGENDDDILVLGELQATVARNRAEVGLEKDRHVWAS